MEKPLNSDEKLLDNINYALTNLEKGINEAKYLEDKIYLELSKSQIIDYLNEAYKNVKIWKENYENKNYEQIIKTYKNVESDISQLELCLIDYENKFKMEGISYSIYEIGKILTEARKENNLNGR